LRFTVRRALEGAGPEAAWAVVKDVEDMSKYWRGHREVRARRLEDGSWDLAIRFAFPGPNNRGRARATLDEAARMLTLSYVEGPVKGIVKVYVTESEIVTEWDVSLAWYLRPLEVWVKRHFMKGAQHALDRIVEAARASLTRGEPSRALSVGER
jgi:hypothetical protein